LASSAFADAETEITDMILMKKRFLLAVMAALVTLAFSTTAAAQTPKYGTFELRFAGYYPAIDDEEGLTGDPFAEMFGNKDRLMFELEVGYHIVDLYGQLGAYGRAGYTNFKGDALTPRAQELGIEADTSDLTTNFRVIPFRAGVYYRFDWLVREYNVPIALVGKAGLDLHWWASQNSNKNTSEFDGEKARGVRPGWHAGAALHLWLDWIDEESAASFDLNWGINSTYLFAEYMITRANGFGSQGFHLNDNQWVFGLAFEY
jgi:hypothetical protein